MFISNSVRFGFYFLLFLSRFFYCRFPDIVETVNNDESLISCSAKAMSDEIGKNASQNLHQKIYYHRVNTSQKDDIEVHKDDAHPHWLFGVEVYIYICIFTNLLTNIFNYSRLVIVENI